MKKGLLFMVLMLLMGARIDVNAQGLTLSDVQNSGCMRGTRARANNNERTRTIILTKEGDILTVQLLGFEANCAIGGFDVKPSMSGGSNDAPYSMSISVKPIEDELMSMCVCPYNVSFSVHGLETNSFRFSCWWYSGQINLTEGEPLTLENITEYANIDGFEYIVEKVSHTASFVGVDAGVTGGEILKDFSIPSETYYEGQKYIVTSIGEGTFMSSYSTTSFTIPSSVTSIGGYVLAYCSSLTDVYCHAENVPTTGNAVFTNTPIASATLHVPAGSIEEYKATSPWSGFGNIVALPIEINETNFPDEEFRNWVLRQEYGKDGVLTDEEIAGVTFVNLLAQNLIAKGNIQSLKGIEYFTAMTKLICQRNELTELDLSKNTALTWLECYGNNLTELNLSKNTELTYLACECNLLTSLDVSDCTKLEELACYENQLTTLNISMCNELKSLKCYLNRLTALDVSDCTSLTTMWCFDNQLPALDVSNCTSLSTLWCGNNLLTQLDVSNNMELIELRCQDNLLTNIDLSRNKKINELRTYHNQINGEAMDALIESLPMVNRGGWCCVLNKEERVVTTTQAAAAKAKGWELYYWNEDAIRWQEYEGYTPSEPVTFTKDQMATIILPSAPDASKGKYYRLDRCEDNQIVFEQELQPRARVPYIIVPSEDFSISPSSLDLEGLTKDSVSIEGVSFIGSYRREALPQRGSGEGAESFYIDIIDKTPDCSLSPLGVTGKGAIIGALRAYLLVSWSDPYNPGGTRGPNDKLEIVLKDDGTGSLTPTPSSERGEIYDLSGRKLLNSKSSNCQIPRGIYIEDGKKKILR